MKHTKINCIVELVHIYMLVTASFHQNFRNGWTSDYLKSTSLKFETFAKVNQILKASKSVRELYQIFY